MGAAVNGPLQFLVSAAGLIPLAILIAGAIVYVLKQRSVLAWLLLLGLVGQRIAGFAASYAGAVTLGMSVGGALRLGPWPIAYWSLEVANLGLGVLFAVCFFLALCSAARTTPATAQPPA
jgi:hypothetical protein